MADNSQESSPNLPPALETPCGEAESDRRWFLSTTTTVIMGGGLVGGYGTFFAMAGRFFFPSGENRQWIFVSDAAGIAPGESFSFQSPDGVDVMITRRTGSGDDSGGAGGSEKKASGESPSVESFLALSSVCPHLGCRVHWEANNNRFFCPCHNGVFDADGVATAGPPAAEGQSLPHYSLQIVDGALYIEMPTPSMTQKT